jgi:hypothetical protein
MVPSEILISRARAGVFVVLIAVLIVLGQTSLALLAIVLLAVLILFGARGRAKAGF